MSDTRPELEEVSISGTRLEEDEVSVSDTRIELSDTIKSMAKFFYEQEHMKKEEGFFDQLYLAARPGEWSGQTMDRMKRIMLVVCYLLASLNNTKINAFKFALAYYLDSAGTSNEGLNTLARAVDRQKKKMSDTHGQHVENVLVQYSQNALVLNIDDYHNIHVQRQPDTTETSSAAHMATILANPCPTPAILRHGALNPKVIDSELIEKQLDQRFIVNLGISYHDRMRDRTTEECPDEELMDKLTLHSYDDRQSPEHT